MILSLSVQEEEQRRGKVSTRKTRFCEKQKLDGFVQIMNDFFYELTGPKYLMH